MGLIKSLLPTIIIKVHKGVCFSKEEKIYQITTYKCSLLRNPFVFHPSV